VIGTASAAEAGGRKLRLLTFSSLYPNAAMPNHGIFVENRLRHLVASGAAEATVLAPVPWFPFRKGEAAGAPDFEQRHGIEVHHPRFLAIPKLGLAVSPALLFACAARGLARLRAEGHVFDLIDAHYFYPDGVAAVWLGRRFGLPVVVTARGSDITQFPDYAVPRRLIRRAALAADGLITVSAGLRTALAGLGVPAERITVLRNGVDLTLFQYQNDAARGAARAALGLDGPTLLSVGALIPRKGHDLTIAALAHLPGWRLLIAGDGPERGALLAQAARLGVAGRVTLLGPRPHAELPALYGAADIPCCPACGRAGPMCCWNRWPAARRWWQAPSLAMTKWCRPKRPAPLRPRERRRPLRPRLPA
jgi:glycosyltransferase involved in cell wall biosynthesis